MWTSPLCDRTVLFLYGETLIAHCLSAPISLWLHSSEKQVVPEAPIFLELWVHIFHCRLNICPWKFHRCLKQSRQNWAPNSLTSASPSASHLREQPPNIHLLQPEIWVSSLLFLHHLSHPLNYRILLLLPPNYSSNLIIYPHFHWNVPSPGDHHLLPRLPLQASF